MKLLKIFGLLSLATILCAGASLRVMVIDTGLDFQNPQLVKYVPKKYLDKKDAWDDKHGHGTHVFGLIVKNACPGVEVIPCKYYENNGMGYGNLEREIQCFSLANKEDVLLINVSGGGGEPSPVEREEIKKLLRRGGILVAAAGNERNDLDRVPYYPACYYHKDNIFRGQVIAVGSLNKDGTKAEYSNFAPWIDWEIGQQVLSILPSGRPGTMSGTSQACAVHTGRIVEQWCKTHKLQDVHNCTGNSCHK